MTKISSESWEQLEKLRSTCWKHVDTIAHSTLYGHGDEGADREIHESEMSLEHYLHDYHRRLVTALERYNLEAEQASLAVDWPPILEAGLRQTSIINNDNGDFGESEALTRLSRAHDALAIPYEAELAELKEQREREAREREAARELASIQARHESKRALTQSLFGLIGVLVGGLLTLAGSCRERSNTSSPQPAVVEGLVYTEGTVPMDVKISCSPELEGVSAITDGKKYFVQTDGATALPVYLSCVVEAGGRRSQTKVVAIKKPGRQTDGPGFQLPTNAQSP